MTPAAAQKHLTRVLTKMEQKEAELQERVGDAYPRSMRASDQKMIQALRAILDAAPPVQAKAKKNAEN